jgi:hypothetical protein
MRCVARGAMRYLIDEVTEEEYSEYRTQLLLSDQAAGSYSWNSDALMRLNKKLKHCVDLNGILALERSSIWPARYRGGGWESLEIVNRRRVME